MDYNGHTASIALFWFLWLLGFISFTRVIEKENVMNFENFFLIELKLYFHFNWIGFIFPHTKCISH